MLKMSHENKMSRNGVNLYESIIQTEFCSKICQRMLNKSLTWMRFLLVLE